MKAFIILITAALTATGSLCAEPGKGRLGITKKEAAKVWGEARKMPHDFGAGEESYLYEKNGFRIAASYIKGRTACIAIDKAKPGEALERSEIAALLKAVGGQSWKPDTANPSRYIRDDGAARAFTSAGNTKIFIMSAAYDDAMAEREKKRKVDAASGL